MNEFLLMDRLQKIRQIVNKYGEELDTLEKYFLTRENNVKLYGNLFTMNTEE